jgi:UDP-2-acetamido-2,6-beta-L-arabino-hexul-4-ose reductase
VKMAITGGYGFLGWHLACRVRALMGVEPLRLGRAEFNHPDALEEALSDVGVVFHIAGVNRAESDDDVEHGNVELADRLATALGNRPAHIVYANSTHADGDSPYGRGKRRASEILQKLPGTLADVQLPNLYGEHGRPHYNSFVATFCHQVANGRSPTVTGDRSIPLLHAQAAAHSLLDAAHKPTDAQWRPPGSPYGISQVLAKLEGFHTLYAQRGEIPDLSEPFSRDLFNTYRSHLFPEQFPIHPALHADNRGVLSETSRAHGGTSQTYISTTLPGQTRGEHYHLHKIERFFLVRGEAEIQLRRLLHAETTTYRLSGDQPGFVDMPTMWVHNLRNVGEDEVITTFWSDQLFDPEIPDQFPEAVEVAQ